MIDLQSDDGLENDHGQNSYDEIAEAVFHLEQDSIAPNNGQNSRRRNGFAKGNQAGKWNGLDFVTEQKCWSPQSLSSASEASYDQGPVSRLCKSIESSAKPNQFSSRVVQPYDFSEHQLNSVSKRFRPDVFEGSELGNATSLRLGESGTCWQFADIFAV